MNERIDKTLKFLDSKLSESKYCQEHEEERIYRYEHSIRVANHGLTIAKKENLNQEAMVLACLLHDVGYCVDFKDHADYMKHGHYSAKIARPFLETLGLEQDVIEDICYGIAIHATGEADYEGVKTIFALSVSDADNIDRYDAFRIYDFLRYVDFFNLSLEDKLLHIEERLNHLNRIITIPCATKTAEKMWKERITYYLDFYEKMKLQFIQTREPLFLEL